MAIGEIAAAGAMPTAGRVTVGDTQAAVADDWSRSRRADLTQSDHRTCLAVLVFYWIDAAFLALFCADGVGSWASPFWFAVVGTVVAGGGAWVVRRHGADSLEDPRLVIVQAGAALTLVLGVALFDADFLALMLVTVIVIIPTAALRITPRGVLMICVVSATASVAVLMAHGGQLTVPLATPTQQTLGGLFLLWTLAKGASVNVASMALRMQLDNSHARLMQGAVRKPDVVGRVGGEEFLMIFTGAAVTQAAHKAADRVRCAIEQHPWSTIAPDLQVTASLGVAVDLLDQPPDDIVARADRGLYQAKGQGRNQVVVVSAEH